MKTLQFSRTLIFIGCLIANMSVFANTYTVDIKTDFDDNGASNIGTNSLRKCIRLANSAAGADIINFSVSGTITITSQLTITDKVTIDGTTSPAYLACKPAIEISGLTNLINLVYFTGTADESVLKSLVLNNGDNGIIIDAGADKIQVLGCYIGTDLTGNVAKPNKSNGIVILSAQNIIGGNGCALRNVISANGSNAIIFNVPGSSSNNNMIVGNYIGVGANGTSSLGNGGEGIHFNGPCNDNTIGGDAPGDGNVISNNGSTGNGDAIHFVIASSGNTIIGNYIGVDATGSAAAGNAGSGINFQAAAGNNNNIIGKVAAKNVIANNKNVGIQLFGGNNNHFVGNYVGIDAGGTLPNFGNFMGINLYRATNSIIDSNVVCSSFSTNGGLDPYAHGIYLANGSSFSKVRGNKVGVDKNGAGVNLGNHGNGITTVDATISCVIGGTNAGEGNIISNNGFGGNGAAISISQGANHTMILGNIIGLNADKTTANGNYHFGIWSDQSSMHQIKNNYIAYNTMHGVYLSASTSSTITGNYIFGSTNDGLQLVNADNDTIWNNTIGLDHLGNIIPNKENGISVLSGTTGALIGDADATRANIIAGNGFNGISISGASNHNSIHKNSIYCNGKRGIELNSGSGNDGYGAPVMNPNASSTLVFGTAPANAFIEIYSIGPSPCVTCSPGLKTIQGKTYITTVQADNTGKWTYTPGAALTETVVLTASESTSGPGNTSEFSVCPALCANPNFTGSITGPNICEGGSTTLTASVSGAVEYKWQVKEPNGVFTDIADGGIYSGSSTASLAITGVSLSINNNQYQLIAKAGNCSAPSNVYTLKVDTASAAGTISTSANRICSGNSATLNLSSSTGSIIWQSSPDSSSWNPISGETLSILNVTNLTSTTYYRVLVNSGVCPSSTSPGSKIKVDPKLVITKQPDSLNVCDGGNATFNVSATNANTYKWQEKQPNGVFTDISEGGKYSGVSSTSLIITGADLTMDGYLYQCVASVDGNCEINTANAVLHVDTSIVTGTLAASAPKICSGSNVSLNLSQANGVITWESSTDSLNWSIIPGESTQKLDIQNLTQTRFYHVIIKSGSCSPSTSAGIKVTVDAPLSINQEPSDKTICENTGTSFVADAPGATSYLWVQDNNGSFTSLTEGGTYTGTTSATLNLSNIPTSLNGAVYRCIIKGGECSDTSSKAKLMVDELSVAGTVSGTTNICSGINSIALSLSGEKGKIVWESSSDSISWTSISGETTSQLNLHNMTQSTFYHVVVSNGVCSPSTSSGLKVKVDPTITISQQPSDKTVCEKTNTSFTTLAPNASYQWVRDVNGVFTTLNDGSGFGGTSSSTLTVSNVAASLNGQVYRCIISAGACSDTSDAAKLGVDNAPVAGNVSGPAIICNGQTNTTISLNGQSGQIKWQSSSDDINFATIPGASGVQYLPGIISTTTYFRAELSNGSCTLVTTNSYKAQVPAPSVPGAVVSDLPSVCLGSSVTLSLKDFKGTIVKWQSSTDTTVYANWKDLGGTDSSISVTPSNTLFYRVFVNNTCGNDSSKIGAVTILKATPFSLGKDTSICEPNEITIKVPDSYSSYLWAGGEKTNSIKVLKAGIYWLEAKSSNSCVFRDTIVVKSCTDEFIPNVFTPNGDGKNELFIIVGLEEGSQVLIYNRWGSLLHDFNPYTNNWDGLDVSEGVYYYLYKKPSKPNAIAGWVEVLK